MVISFIPRLHGHVLKSVEISGNFYFTVGVGKWNLNKYSPRKCLNDKGAMVISFQGIHPFLPGMPKHIIRKKNWSPNSKWPFQVGS